MWFSLMVKKLIFFEKERPIIHSYTNGSKFYSLNTSSFTKCGTPAAPAALAVILKYQETGNFT